MKQFKTSEEFTQAAENQTLEGFGLRPAEKEGVQRPWHMATGDLPVPMTNDYLFRALMQKNNKVLKGLISALLHLPPSEISSAVIMNPIELGDAIDRKTFILDIKVSLNDSIILSLEMQVVNEHNWAERSLSYMYRSFDQLNAGNKYQDMRPVIQIGIVNFSLFPESPEFYATYKFLNEKNHTLYSDKLRVSVLDLTQIDRATEEDRSWQIDYWATLFKSITWEEIIMLAEKNEYISEAADTIYHLTQDEKIRMQCEAREDYYRTRRGWQDMLEEKDAMLKEMDAMLKEKDAMLKEKDAMLEEKDAIIRLQESALAEQKAALETVGSELNNLVAWAKKQGYEE